MQSLELPIEQLQDLLKQQKLFNLHLKVFKQLLNLKELPSAERINFFRDSFTNKREIDNQIEANASNCANHSTNTTEENNRNDNRVIKRQSNRINRRVRSKEELVKQTIEDLQNQLIQSQLLVTCLVHNLQLIRRRALKVPVVDLIGSDQLLRHLRDTHTESRSNRAIFTVACDQKRESLQKLKQQLKDTRLRCWRAIRFNLDRPQFDPLPIDLRPTLSPTSTSNSNSTTTKPANQLDDLVEAMEKRNERLNRLEADCRTFLTKLEQKYGDSKEDEDNGDGADDQADRDNDSLDLLASVEWANLDASLDEFELDDNDELLDEVSDEEEEDDEEAEEEQVIEIDDHNLIASNGPEVSVREIERDALIDLIEEEEQQQQQTNGERQASTTNDNNDRSREHDMIVNLISSMDELAPGQHSPSREQEINNLIRFNEIIEENETHRLSLPETTNASRSRRLSDGTSSPVLNSSEQNLAETGEPVQLCRLRRRAVEVLASRWRTERAYYEQRENELKDQLSELQKRLDETNQSQEMKLTNRFWISTYTCCILGLGSLIGWIGSCSKQ